MSWIRAVAVDLDGTIATQDSVSDVALKAVRDMRFRRVRTLLVTGRTMAALYEGFPGLVDEFDAVVAENGGVLLEGGRERTLSDPVPAALAESLERQGIPLQRGQVLLATGAAHDEEVLREIGMQGLDCWLLRNRGELMVLPAGVSKGTGVAAAMAGLGLSEHSLIAVGDAENDHSLFEAAELAAATSDAVPALRDHADLVLAAPNGDGVAGLIFGPVLSGEERPRSDRRQLVLGTLANGSEAKVPSTPSTMLVVGGSGRGKSFLAGVIAEQLVEAGYSLVVVDPHGEQTSLGQLAGVTVCRPEQAGDVRSAVQQLRRGTSVVVDLSGVGDCSEILDELATVISRTRADTGFPHWILIDEAQDYLGQHGHLRSAFDPTAGGYCLVTYRPEELCSEVLAAADVVLSVSPPVDQVLGGHGLPASGLPKALAGQATIVRADIAAAPQAFSVASRHTTHQRHEHKYSRVLMPQGKGFRFRRDASEALPEARSVEQFRADLQQIDPAVVGFHLGRGDFSRWLGESLQDRKLADLAARLEREVAARHEADVVHARIELCQAILDRYPEQENDEEGDGPTTEAAIVDHAIYAGTRGSRVEIPHEEAS